MSEPPAPRYTFVERDGRIMVTDTWAEGGRPPSMTSHAPTPIDRRGATRGWLDRPIRLLVAIACQGATNDAGRPIFSTLPYYDESGPRDILLSDSGMRRLGGALVAAAAGIVALIALCLWFDWLIAGAVILIGLFSSSANTTFRPAITRWLGTLGDEIPNSATLFIAALLTYTRVSKELPACRMPIRSRLTRTGCRATRRLR